MGGFLSLSHFPGFLLLLLLVIQSKVVSCGEREAMLDGKKEEFTDLTQRKVKSIQSNKVKFLLQ